VVKVNGAKRGMAPKIAGLLVLPALGITLQTDVRRIA
jgi:hypothetical protein